MRPHDFGSFDLFVDALKRAGLRVEGNRFQCPSHDDRNPSASFREGDSKSLIARCHAEGCGAQLPAMLDALQVSDEERAAILGTKLRAVAPLKQAFVYLDAAGAEVYRAVRTGAGKSKRVYLERANSTGGWRSGRGCMEGCERVPYRLPQVLRAIERGEVLHVAEGEKCVEALERIGLAATCNAGGAGKWQPNFAEVLKAACAARVHADNDDPGREHAAKVAESFRRVGVTDLRIIPYPGAPGRDVADWLAERADQPIDDVRSELLAYMDSSPQAEPKAIGDVAAADQVFRVEGESIALADRALAALTTDANPELFVRARQIVRVVRDRGRESNGLRRPVGAPVIERVGVDALRDRLARVGPWLNCGGRIEREILPPEWLVRNILARPSWPLPQLQGVIEAPTMRPDGSILETPGYDDETGLLLEPSGEFPRVPDHPTVAETKKALVTLLEPFRDFPFREASDRAAAIAAVLSLVGRSAIEGPVPLFAVRAPTPGTGKSLLADVVAIIATGRAAARMTPDGDDGETRKRILAVAIEGAAAVLLDNVDGRLGSRSLAAALTSEFWTDRLLGASAMVEAPLRAVWIATGNNIAFRGDLGRRVVPIDLDSKKEHPEDRPAESFRYPELRAHVVASRPRLVTAALTVLRAYHQAGRPKQGKPRKGSFEAWDDLVRGACVWAALGDPDAGKERVRNEDDSDLAALGAALEACSFRFGSEPFTAADLVRRAQSDAAKSDTVLQDALVDLVPGKDRLGGANLGYALRNVRGRIVGNKRFEKAGDQRLGTNWRVEDV